MFHCRVHLTAEIFEKLRSVSGYFLKGFVTHFHFALHNRYKFGELLDARKRCLEFLLYQVELNVKLTSILMHIFLNF